MANWSVLSIIHFIQKGKKQRKGEMWIVGSETVTRKVIKEREGNRGKGGMKNVVNKQRIEQEYKGNVGF